MSWVLAIAKSAYKELRRFSKKDIERIVGIFTELPLNPYAGDMEKLEGEDDIWRRRIGQYRIFYHLNKERKIISVFRIERRTSVTY